MKQENVIQKYSVLIASFLRGDVSITEFEKTYINLFKQEDTDLPDVIYQALNSLFLDLEEYCNDPSLREDGDPSVSDIFDKATVVLEALDKWVSTDSTK